MGRLLRSPFLPVALLAVAGGVSVILITGWTPPWAQPRPSWSSAQLIEKARAGQVRSVVITNADVTATDRRGTTRRVLMAGTATGSFAQELTSDGVDVTYISGGLALWAWPLAADLIIAATLMVSLVLVGGLVYVASRPGGRLKG